MKNLRAIHAAFDLYANLSGQHVNWDKSHVYFGRGVFSSRISNLTSVGGMKQGCDSLTYLCVLLFVGAPRQQWLIPWR